MNIQNLQGALPASVFRQLDTLVQKYKINTISRMSHFLAQCAHESGDWKVFEENLNYSKAGLLKIFKKYFNETTATQYARKPQAIANRVYANRMSNGDEASGDGWKFRGRGFIQLTGRANYSAFNSYVDENILESPELVAGKYALESAAWFWVTNRLNELSDTGTVQQVTQRVNGGQHGITDRVEKHAKYRALLSVPTSAPSQLAPQTSSPPVQ
jgi:putative chitinase